eukprot:1157914-Pelagomonas_calceolata.AAC.1
MKRKVSDPSCFWDLRVVADTVSPAIEYGYGTLSSRVPLVLLTYAVAGAGEASRITYHETKDDFPPAIRIGRLNRGRPTLIATATIHLMAMAQPRRSAEQNWLACFFCGKRGT